MPHYKILFNELAESEFVIAFQYYEQQQIGLGVKFEIDTEFIIQHISENPYIFQRKFKHYREAPLNKFPYFIVYEIFEKTVMINSFFHTSRNPKGKLKAKR